MNMKPIFLIGIFGLLASNLFEQDDQDYIDRSPFFIKRASPAVKGELMKSASSLRTSMDVETQCGSNYTVLRTYGEMTDTYYSEYRYSDGLILTIPEGEGGKVAFAVTGDACAMLLPNGNQVIIGMKGDELSRLFPKSYANRKPISDTRGKEGKISFVVHLAYTADNQIHKEDAFIRFIINQDTGSLEESYYYEPL